MADDSKLSKLADELDDSEDEITAEHYFRVEKGGTLIVDQTGKHKALGPDEPTPTDPHVGRKHSAPPKSGIPGILAAGAGGVVRIIGAVNSWPAVFGLALLVVALGLYLHFRR